MTCIVGIAHQGKVYMGGDSAAVEEETNSISVRKEPKVFIRGEYIIGYAGSFRMGKVLEHSFNYPVLPAQTDIDKFLNTTFISKLRECLEENKLDLDNDKDAADVLLGTRGRIFEFNMDFHFGEDRHNFASVGSGANVALGSLHSTSHFKDQFKRCKMALEAAQEFNAWVRPPFTILEK